MSMPDRSDAAQELSILSFAIRLLLAPSDRELLIASGKVVPAGLEAAGYRFRYPTIDTALAAALRDWSGAVTAAIRGVR